MRIPVLLFLLLFALHSVAQTTATADGTGAAPGPTANAAAAALSPELDRLQVTSTETAAVIGRMRIEKWKVDSQSKRQAQSNADSIERNLTSALPSMISTARSAPQELAAQFKLYRNLNALYDVLSSLTESAGAFGPKNEYNALATQLSQLDAARRKLGDMVEQSASAQQAEIEQLRSQVRTLQQPAVAAAPPKKVVVDESEPPKKPTTTHKKKSTATPAATGSSSSGSSPAPPSPK